jgi:hypothetical protein
VTTLYTRIIVAAMTLVIMAGMFFAGYWVGKSRQQVQYVKAEGSVLRDWAQTVSDISTSVTALAVAAANQRAEVRANTQKTVDLGERYVQKTIPDRSRFDVPDYLLQLRLCQVDALYKAAGADLPADRVGATCPPALPENK